MDSEDDTVVTLTDEEEEEVNVTRTGSKVKKAKEHVNQLQRLQQKDPEFYQFLKEHDKELLEFNEDGIDEDAETDMDDEEIEEDEEETKGLDVEEPASIKKKEAASSKRVITSAMVDSWCNAVRENSKAGPVRSLIKVYRTACHYGDDGGDDPSTKFSVMSSSVFNKILLFVLNEMDGLLRGLLQFPAAGGKKETIKELMKTKQWKNYNHLVRSYLGNSLHVLNQMTNTEMISFTLRRLRYSAVFLAAFPTFLRKYVKVALHFWGTGGGALPVVSFLFIRDLCVRLGSDCIDDCFKGMYKAYVVNCNGKSINAMGLQHIQFLGNCFIELLGVDLPTAYQHAFMFIRQLGMLLREALNMQTKDEFRKVYEWKFINCLELWTGAICAYSSEVDFRPLTYPLTQIISGVARLVPTARYVPLRLRCVKMLNRIAASTGTFIPVSLLLLDMLEMKELGRPPLKDASEAIDMRTTLKVSKTNTREFQEACVYSVAEELAEHLSQWSYSVAFFELSFIPLVRLRSFCKSTKVERFRKEMKQLILQIEANSEFTNEKRMSTAFLPNDPTATAILEDEKKSRPSPLSRYVATLRERAQWRNDALSESSVLVGEHSSVFGKKPLESDDEDDTRNEEGAAVFSSSWLPGSDSREKRPKEEKKKENKKNKRKEQEDGLSDEDVVEDFIPSSDEDESERETRSPLAETKENSSPLKKQSKKRKASAEFWKNKKSNFSNKNSKKRRKAKANRQGT